MENTMDFYELGFSHGRDAAIYCCLDRSDKLTRAQSIRARMRAGGVKFDKGAEWYQTLEEGSKAPTTPDFETAQNEADYYAGYHDGYNDIDD